MCHVVAHFAGGRTLIRLAILAAVASGLLIRSLSAEPIDFNAQVRPLLAEYCLQCHGPDEATREADLRLDVRDGAIDDRGGEAAIVAGDPARSLLWQRISTGDDDLRMPPVDTGLTLSDQQRSMLRQWIAEGASYETHWSFQPIQRPPLPEGDDLPTELTDIDRFVVHKLQDRGLQLSPAADKQTLIRRVTFDLTGLPPTWDEVQSFVADESPDALAKLVDRLLDSPRYGERWARHWLDIARYADTHGGTAIGFQRFPFSYTYRDWVVDAFNGDLPYDQFILQQLAADQLAGNSDSNREVNAARTSVEADHSLAALGFLTVGRQFRNRHDLIDDQIDVVTRGLMGVTVACARCHDHKYDPIPTRDYYALYATFAPSSPPEQLPLVAPVAETDTYANYQDELARREQRLTDTVAEQSEVLRSRLRMQVGLYLTALAEGMPEQDLSTAFLSYRTEDLRPLVLERWRKYLREHDADDPVFGPWHRLQALPPAEFASSWSPLVEGLEAENGELAKLELHRLGTEPPRWNPRVLDALKRRQPGSMVDVAGAYGDLFATVAQEWLSGLLQASLEAAEAGEIIPDEDPRHEVLNSSVNRQLRRHLWGPDSPCHVDDLQASRLLNRPINDHVGGLRGAIHDWHLNAPGSPPRAMSLVEAEQPQSYFVFRRGDPLNRGVEVAARPMQVLGGDDDRPFADGQRRLGLAQAIVDPANPLTRRVIVNWVWQRHFGLGLVRTPDDFGTRGSPPTHPELLDYLAETLLDDGWSLKQLHRRIVLSRVYQQQAIENPRARALDPENRLLWRMPRRRLEAEAMRDAMLYVAGRLDETRGGRPFDLFSPSSPPRRSIYGFVNRDVVADFFSTFDMADPSVCVAKRPSTTVPQQTLFALNSEFVQNQARHLATHPDVVAAESPADRVQRMVQRAYSRAATGDEIATALEYVNSHRTPQDPAEPDLQAIAWQRLAHVLLAANEFLFVD